jgi:hypothetical protein
VGIRNVLTCVFGGPTYVDDVGHEEEAPIVRMYSMEVISGFNGGITIPSV